MSSIVQVSYQFTLAVHAGSENGCVGAVPDFLDYAAGECYTRKFGLWRSLASALAWGARGPGFKSRQPDQNPSKTYGESTLSETAFGVQLESNIPYVPSWTALGSTIAEPLFSCRNPTFPTFGI